MRHRKGNSKLGRRSDHRLAMFRNLLTSLFRHERVLTTEAKAKALCLVCPVRDVCLEFALKIRESHGIWGGLNEFERRQILRRRTLQAG